MVFFSSNLQDTIVLKIGPEFFLQMTSHQFSVCNNRVVILILVKAVTLSYPTRILGTERQHSS